MVGEGSGKGGRFLDGCKSGVARFGFMGSCEYMYVYVGRVSSPRTKIVLAGVDTTLFSHRYGYFFAID